MNAPVSSHSLDIQWIKGQIEETWEPGFGNVHAEEAYYIIQEILHRDPALYVEVGVASGISTGLAAAAMNCGSGKKLIGIDTNPNFLQAPTGRKAREIDGSTGQTVVSINAPSTTAELSKLLVEGEVIDMAFIDGNHQHPWPLFDTIFILPYMSKRGCIFHHDLDLYRVQQFPVSIGPKYLYDQFPDTRNVLDHNGRKNIFYINTHRDISYYEHGFSRAMLMPWSNTDKIPLAYAVALYEHIRSHFSVELLRAFDKAWSRS